MSVCNLIVTNSSAVATVGEKPAQVCHVLFAGNSYTVVLMLFWNWPGGQTATQSGDSQQSRQSRGSVSEKSGFDDY